MRKQATLGYHLSRQTKEDTPMSDSLRTYHAVEGRVCQTLPEAGAYLTTNVSLMMTGLVRSRSVQQKDIAGEVPLRTQDRSFEQRQRRFLTNERVQVDALYAPFIRPFLQACQGPMIPIILDGSAAGYHCQMLMAAIGYQHRALPLAWLVRKGQKGRFPATDHLEVTKHAAQFVPEDTDVVLLGDGEFGNVPLARDATLRNWYFVFRVACDDTIWVDGEQATLSEFRVQPDEVLWLEGILWTGEQFGPVNVVVTWNEDEQTPMYLVTNFDLHQEALYWYDRRFWIEPMFRDDKSMGFNLQTSHLRDPKRVARLLLIVCLAYLWILFLGTLAVFSCAIRLISRADRRDCSLFSYGLRWLRRFLRLNLYIPVRFCPYRSLHLRPAGRVG
jgi:hypothetical protein